MEAIGRIKHFIRSTFILNDPRMMCQAGRLPKQIQVLCDAFLLHPILMSKKSRMVVSRVEIGGFPHAAKKYIRKALQNNGNIDRRILFITYAGVDKEKLQYIQNLVQQYCPFEHVYLQKASAAIVSNCGPGTFGLLFMKRDDSSIPFFQISDWKGTA